MTLGITKGYTPAAGEVANATSYNTDIAALFNAFSGLEAQTSTLGGLTILPAADSTTALQVKNAAATSVFQVNTTSALAMISGAVISPMGTVSLFAGATAPTGWMLCDGTAISRATYSVLFALIGTTYGEGDTTTTFNLPDLRDKFAIGKSGTKALGTTAGSSTIGLTNLPSHDHGGATGTESATHTHNCPVPAAGGVTTYLAPQNGTGTNPIATGNASATHTHTITAAGGGVAYYQPYQALNYIIRVL
jgi:microcystin-dependent protein